MQRRARVATLFGVAVRHELSWSTTRAGVWQTCARRYYYDYYYSWGGWDERADPARRRAWLLKKMTRMPMLAGDALHQAIAWWLGGKARGEVAEESAVVEHALRILRGGYKDSRDGLWKLRPAKRTRLAEHHYREPAIDEASGAAAEYGRRFVERIRAGVAAFFHDPRLEPARASEPSRWLACEEMGSFALDGVKVFAVPDFAFTADDGTVRIYDWKSGRPRPEDRVQLGVYALYAEASWRADPTAALCVDAYLGEGEVIETRFEAGELAELRERIRSTLAAMRELHYDADRDSGDAERFPMLEPGPSATRECAQCNYRELCGR